MITIKTPNRTKLLIEIKDQVETIQRFADSMVETINNEQVFPKSLCGQTLRRECDRAFDKLRNRAGELGANLTCLNANLSEENASREINCIDDLIRFGRGRNQNDFSTTQR